VTDDNAFGGAGVDEVPVLEEYAHVGQSPSFLFREIEEHEVTGLYPAFPDALAVFTVYVRYRPLQ
jgi:hypothetical protein